MSDFDEIDYEQGPRKIILDLKPIKLEYTQLEKGMVLTIDDEAVGVKLFEEDKEKRSNFSLGNFYENPSRLELFVCETGKFDGKDAYLIERAIRFGQIESLSNDLLSQRPDEGLKIFRFFYHDGLTDEIKEFDLKQFSSKIVEGILKVGADIVYREGKLMVGDEIIPLSYLSVLSPNRESYVTDPETNNFKKMEEFL